VAPPIAAAASAKFSTRFVSSLCRMLCGMVTVRFVSSRGAQNLSERCTSVNGTGAAG
jgi:hypothetical protein